MPIATELWTSARVGDDGFWKRPGVYEPQVDRLVRRYARPVTRVMHASGPTCPPTARRVCALVKDSCDMLWIRDSHASDWVLVCEPRVP